MENTSKKTKAMYFAELREMVMNVVKDEEKQDELVTFIDKQIESLEKRKVAAAARAEKKKAESDTLTDQIYEMLDENFVTINEIVENFDTEDITHNKISARLGKLVKNGLVVKEPVKTEDGKRMAYRRATAEDAKTETED